MGKYVLMLFMFLTFTTFGGDYTSLLIADKDGKIIYEEDSWKLHPFASVTKLMTASIVMEKIQEGKISYDDMVYISKDAGMMGGSRVELYWGSYVKLKDLLYASLIHSANNATYALAEYVAGSADKFVKLMNKKAMELGMKDTTFFTPTGLPPEFTGKGMDVGTAEDILKLSLYALNNKEIMDIVGMSQVDISNSRDVFTIYNRNKLLKRTKGVTGLKTGHHTEAGYNMTVSFINHSKEYIAVIFGSSSEQERDNELNYLISHFDENDFYEKYVNKQKIINDKKEYIASYAVSILIDTLEEVNKGVLANYKPKTKQVEIIEEKKEKLENQEKEVKLEEQNSNKNTEISKEKQIKNTNIKEQEAKQEIKVKKVENKKEEVKKKEIIKKDKTEEIKPIITTETKNKKVQKQNIEKNQVVKKEKIKKNIVNKKSKSEDIIIIKDDVDKILKEEQELINEYIYIRGDIGLGDKRNTVSDDYGVKIISD